MALDDTYSVVQPDQLGGTGATTALTVTGYDASVFYELERISKIAPLFTPTLIAQGTDTLTKYAFGSEAQPGKIVPGAKPDGQTTQQGKHSLTVDELILMRHNVALLAEWQTRFDIRSDIGKYHGRAIAKLIDKTYAIVATKAALATSTFIQGQGSSTGFNGGSQVTFDSASAAQDPGAFIAALNALFVKFEQKDVDPRADGLGILVRPEEFAVLSDADALISADWITSAGNTLQGIPMLKHKGVPIVSSNSTPFGTNVTSHVLNNTRNSNSYNVDATKVRAVVVGPDAVLGGNAIPLTTNAWYNPEYLIWQIDAYLSFGATPSRAEYAGALLIP